MPADGKSPQNEEAILLHDTAPASTAISKSFLSPAVAICTERDFHEKI